MPVDVWTYTCINRRRTFPSLRALSTTYAGTGLAVLGGNGPELGFEKDHGNVAKAVQRFGVTEPVAEDSEMATWNASRNHFRPPDSLIASAGKVRSAHFGEGGDDEVEAAMRSVLAEDGRRVGRAAGRRARSASWGCAGPAARGRPAVPSQARGPVPAAALTGRATARLARSQSWVAPLLLGVVLGTAFTSCVGHSLGTVLAFAASSGAGTGALLLAAFALGLGVPFVFVFAALAVAASPGLARRLTRASRNVSLVGSAVLLVLGLALVTGSYGAVAGWFARLLPSTAV